MESWKEQLKTKILESEFSIKEISDKTKIPTKFIEAIEMVNGIGGNNKGVTIM